MVLIFFIICSVCLTLSHGKRHAQNAVRKFPEGVLLGSATSAYQTEGAWDADGKAENIWDRFTYTHREKIADGSNGDIADDSYHLYQRDVEMMRELGFDFYRFSLSWTRILPTSFPNHINEAGVAFYNNLINEMIKYNIEPMITLYHFDLPQKLQEMGGWSNPYVVDWFGDYSRVAFELFGDRVKYWVTINEPESICNPSYGSDIVPPILNIKGVAEHMCTKNMLVAHARAYHMYNEKFKTLQNDIIGLVSSGFWYEPETENDVAAAERNLFEWGQYVHPIFSETGDFPPVMKERIAEYSANQGFFRSRLPEFTREEVEYVKGSSDFLGLNHYTTYLVYRNESVINLYDKPSALDDAQSVAYQPDEWPTSASSFLKVVPSGFYKILTKLREDYDNPPIFITENGYSSHGGLDDDDRIFYFRSYLNAMLDAIDEGSDIKACTAWSLMDNFEWIAGFSERFGLYEVDYESEFRTRTPRKSASSLRADHHKEMIRTRSLDFDFEPDTTVMTIDEGH